MPKNNLEVKNVASVQLGLPMVTEIPELPLYLDDFWKKAIEKRWERRARQSQRVMEAGLKEYCAELAAEQGSAK